MEDNNGNNNDHPWQVGHPGGLQQGKPPVNGHIGPQQGKPPGNGNIGPQQGKPPVNGHIGPQQGKPPGNGNIGPQQGKPPVNGHIGPQQGKPPVNGHIGPQQGKPPGNGNIGPQQGKPPVNGHIGPQQGKPPVNGHIGPQQGKPPVNDHTLPGVVDTKETLPVKEYGGFGCWGYGEFGQHGHGDGEQEVSFSGCEVDQFAAGGEHRVKLVACGASHTVVVTDENRIFTWGNGNSGQLGCGGAVTQWSPVEVLLCPGEARRPVVLGISTGGRHTFLWLANGHMYSWGNNFYAQLGYDFRIPNYKENQLRPHLLETLSYKPVVQVACGEKHSLLLFQHGVVSVVGNNCHGQVGDDGRTEAVLPKEVEGLPPVRHIAAGSNHNVVVTVDGAVYAWGLGKGCGLARGDVLEPRSVPLRSKVRLVQVAAGQSHSLALTDLGTVYSWGHGANGQLGHGDQLQYLDTPRRLRSRHLPRPMVQVCCGENYSAAVTANGSLYMWGKSSHVLNKVSSKKVFIPQHVNAASHPVATLSCGSWHAAAILGQPESRGRGRRSPARGAGDGALRPGAAGGGGGEGQAGVADRCTQTSRLSWQSCTAITEAESDLSSLSDEDSLDDPLEDLTDAMSHHGGPRPAAQGISRTLTLAEFYAPSPSPQLTRRAGAFRRPDTMEVVPLSSRRPGGLEEKSMNYFSDMSESCSEWRPAHPGGAAGSNGLASETEDTLEPLTRSPCKEGPSVGHNALSASRTSLTISELEVHGLGPSGKVENGLPTGGRESKEDEGSAPGEGMYTSAGINQGVVQLSKSRSADFVLPRERSSLHSQNLDVSAVPPADATPTPRPRFHIDQHVAVHLQPAARSGSSTSSSKASSSGSSQAQTVEDQRGVARKQGRIQAPHVAFRRARTVYGMQANSGKGKQGHPEENTPPQPKSLSKEPQEYAFMIPRTVTFIASEEEGDPSQRGTPSRRPGRKGASPGLSLRADKKPHQMAQSPGAASPGLARKPIDSAPLQGKPGGTGRGRTMSWGAHPRGGEGDSPQHPHSAVTITDGRSKTTLNLYMRPSKDTRWNRPSRR